MAAAYEIGIASHTVSRAILVVVAVTRRMSYVPYQGGDSRKLRCGAAL